MEIPIVYIRKMHNVLEDSTRKLLQIQTEVFAQLINYFKLEDDWQSCQSVLSLMFFYKFLFWLELM